MVKEHAKNYKIHGKYPKNWWVLNLLCIATLSFLVSSQLNMNIHWPCYCTVYADICVYDSVGSFSVETNLYMFFIVCLRMYCRWRFNYQLFQSMTGIFIAICFGFFHVQWLGWEVVARFDNINGIVDYHRLNFLFTVIFSDSLTCSFDSPFHISIFVLIRKVWRH